VVGQPEKKWVNQRPAKEAKEGDKPVKGPGGEVITSDGTTKENAPGLRANLGMTLEEDEPPEQFVTSNTGATAIFGNDKELPVDASELVFPEDELVGQGARPWELDDKFDAEGDALMGGHSRRSEGVGASKVDDEPKSPLEHEEVDTVLEDIVTGPTSAPRTSTTAAATSSPLSSSTKASSSSPSSSASLSSNQDNSTPSSSSSNNSSSSSNNGSSSSGGNNNNNNNSGNNNDGGDSPPPPPKTGKEVAKVSIPDEYPQVLALPITRRPLFPGELH
jgi:hypothetical protein